MKIVGLAVSIGDTECVMPLEDAKKLYNELHVLFGDKPVGLTLPTGTRDNTIGPFSPPPTAIYGAKNEIQPQ